MVEARVAGEVVDRAAGAGARVAGPKHHALDARFVEGIDVVPTILEATGVAAPESVNGIPQKPFDGVSMVSGYNNASENVLQLEGSAVIDQTGMSVRQAVDAIRAVNGRAFVVLQDGARTTWRDYVAVEMA